MLIKLFDQKAYVFAELWITASVIGIFFQPLLGRLIDRLGERTILLVDAVSMTIPILGGWVWLAYGPAWVFAGAGGIAILMFVFAAQVRVPERQRPA